MAGWEMPRAKWALAAKKWAGGLDKSLIRIYIINENGYHYL
jgi:hypothetical protein